ALQFGDLLAGGRVPHPDRLVLAGRREGLPVRPPCQRDHHALVPRYDERLGRVGGRDRTPGRESGARQGRRHDHDHAGHHVPPPPPPPPSPPFPRPRPPPFRGARLAPPRGGRVAEGVQPAFLPCGGVCI